MSKGRLSPLPEDHSVYDFSGNLTPKILRGPKKPFSDLTRQEKDSRTMECVGRIKQRMKEVSHQLIR